MFASIVVTVVILAALANAFRPGRSDMITSRPYNNRYNPSLRRRGI